MVPGAAPLDIGKASVGEIGRIGLVTGGMVGVSTGTNPLVVFAEALRFPETGRFCLAVDVLAARDDIVQVVVYSGESFDVVDTRSVVAEAPDGWHRFEVEITSLVRGKRVRLRLDPTSTKGRRLGVRDAQVCRIQE